MSELRENSTTTSEQAPPGSSIRVSSSPSPGVSHSMDLMRESSTCSSPISTVEGGEKISNSEKSKGLTRAHSMSDPQLSLTATTSQTISLNLSPVKAHSSNTTPVSSPPRIVNKSPSRPIVVGGERASGQDQTERKDSSDYSAGHSFGFYQPPATTTCGAMIIRTSTTESLDQSSAATSIDASPIKLDDDRMKSTLISDIDDDDGDDMDQSLNDIIMGKSPQLGGGGGVLSSTLSPSASKPPQRRLVWTELESNNKKSSTPAHVPSLSVSAPATRLTVKSSPVSHSLVAPTPVYPTVQLSPMYSSAVNAHSTGNVRLTPGSANVTLTSPSTFSRGATHSSSLMNESMSRVTLMEKHKKHMDDLKLYYESELSELRKKLDKLESETIDTSAATATMSARGRRSLSPLSPNFASTQRTPLPTTPRQTRQMYFPSSLMKGRSSRASGQLYCIVLCMINLLMEVG